MRKHLLFNSQPLNEKDVTFLNISYFLSSYIYTLKCLFKYSETIIFTLLPGVMH